MTGPAPISAQRGRAAAPQGESPPLRSKQHPRESTGCREPNEESCANPRPAAPQQWGAFWIPGSSEPRRTAFLRGGNGDQLWPHQARIKTRRNQPTLFDFPPVDPAAGEFLPTAPEDIPPPIPIMPAAAEARTLPIRPPPVLNTPRRRTVHHRQRRKSQSPRHPRRHPHPQEHRAGAAARHPGGEAGARPLRRLRPRRPVDLPRSGHRPLQGCQPGRPWARS